MSESWKKFDLEGAGLQRLNMELARSLRKRSVAYLLWVLFPVGAHRAYLGERLGSLAYVVLTALTLILALALNPTLALAPLAVEGGFALFDLFWIERRLVAVNKQVRMDLYLGAGAAPPAGYQGRYGSRERDPEEGAEELLQDYVQVKETERGGHAPVSHDAPGDDSPRRSRMPSFAEQERMLRELGKSRKKDDDA